MKILLWAPLGAGTHYWGPGISAFNLYSTETDFEFSLSVAHGYKHHDVYSLYRDQYFISPLNRNSRIPLCSFLWRSKKWIRSNAKAFDAVHVLGDHIRSFLPALWFEQEGVPAFIKPVGADGGLSLSSKIAKFSGWKKFKLAHVNNITGYISISSRISQDLLSINVSPGKIHNIPNGVNCDRFFSVSEERKRALRKELNLDNAFTVIFSGSIEQRKNPSVVVRAFESFGEEPGIQLIIIGPVRDGGYEMKKIEQAIKSGVSVKVHVVPFTPSVEKYYMASDVFILPSSNEGLSNSLLEAQACGLPALVTKVSGSEDLIKEGHNGIYVLPDEADIASKITYYFSNPDMVRQHGRNARLNVCNHHSSKVILEKHLNLFKNA